MLSNRCDPGRIHARIDGQGILAELRKAGVVATTLKKLGGGELVGGVGCHDNRLVQPPPLPDAAVQSPFDVSPSKMTCTPPALCSLHRWLGWHGDRGRNGVGSSQPGGPDRLGHCQIQILKADRIGLPSLPLWWSSPAWQLRRPTLQRSERKRDG